MLSLSHVSKAYAGRSLFEDITLTLSKGEKLGLVGRNGCGKSTLTKIILGLEDADSGDVIFPKGYQPGHLDQHIHFTKSTLLAEACTGLPADQSLETYKAEKILFGLGFTIEDLEKDPTTFSGGYQLRINLAKCLLGEPDLLILDEPTNYLDILSLHWMKGIIKNYRGEVILITHDKSFMDNVVNHVGGIHRGQFKKIKGTTDKYYELLSQDEEIYEKTRLNTERKKQELEKFIDRFKAKASKSTQAQSRVKQLEKLDTKDKLHAVKTLGFQFSYKQTPAKQLLKVNDLNFGYDENLLIQNLGFEVKKDDRIGIIGKNGKGKTTLLNLIYGAINKPDETELYFHPSTQQIITNKHTEKI